MAISLEHYHESYFLLRENLEKLGYRAFDKNEMPNKYSYIIGSSMYLIHDKEHNIISIDPITGTYKHCDDKGIVFEKLDNDEYLQRDN